VKCGPVREEYEKEEKDDDDFAASFRMLQSQI
jgi:hypothetical protein